MRAFTGSFRFDTRQSSFRDPIYRRFRWNGAGNGAESGGAASSPPLMTETSRQRRHSRPRQEFRVEAPGQVGNRSRPWCSRIAGGGLHHRFDVIGQRGQFSAERGNGLEKSRR